MVENASQLKHPTPRASEAEVLDGVRALEGVAAPAFNVAAQQKLCDIIRSPLLAYECLERKTAIVRMLVEEGADIHDNSNNGPHQLILGKDSVEWLRACLNCGLDANRVYGIPGEDGGGAYNTLLLDAIGQAADGCALALIDAGARVAPEGSRPWLMPLYAAALHNRRLVVERLLREGAPVNVCDASGETPLHVCEDPLTLRMLLDAGADVDAVILGEPASGSNAGATPLQRLLTSSFKDQSILECITMLLEYGASLERRVYGHTLAAVALADERVAPLVRAHLARQAACQALQEIAANQSPGAGRSS